MEALKSDYFHAVCLLVREDRDCMMFGVPELGLNAALCASIRWYLDGPSYHKDLVRKARLKEVFDARDPR